MPHRDHYLFVCINRRDDANPRSSCAQKGSEEIAKMLKSSIKTKGAVRTVRSCTSSCLDMCETGVTIVVEPEHVVYGHVTKNDVDDIINAAAQGKIVDRLVVAGRPSESALIPRADDTEKELPEV